MTERNFRQLLEGRWAQGLFACVGLDSKFERIPNSVHDGNCVEGKVCTPNVIASFNQKIVEATHDLVCAFKPNFAFYEKHGAEGISALKRTIEFIRKIAPDVPVILDVKRGDIGNTNTGSVEMAFDLLGADAVTVNPYLGGRALAPFLERADKGIFILCRTSNEGADEFQCLSVNGTPLYVIVARHFSGLWNTNNNCGFVVGATAPDDELRRVRTVAGDMPILIPGTGEQGGDLEKSVAFGKDSRGKGMIINSSRGIIFASKGPDFAEAARRETEKLHNSIRQYLEKES